MMGPPSLLLGLGLWSLVLVNPLLSLPATHNGSFPKNDSLAPPRSFPIARKRDYEPISWEDTDSENDFDLGSGSDNQSRAQLYHVFKDTEQYLTGGWLTLFVPSLYTLVAIVSLPLNITTILVFLTKMKMKKPAVVYMFNLAFADVLFASMLPFKIAYHFSGNNWVFGPEMCRFVTATFYCNMYCSILLVMVISIDRFLAVVYPMESLSWRTLNRASVVCIAIWLVAITGVIPLVITEQTQKIPDLSITTCYDVLDKGKLQGYYFIFFTVFSSLFFFVPLIICSACYISIIWCLSSSDIAAKQSKKTRALLLSVAVFSIFVLCFGPTNVLLLVHYIHFSYKSYTGSIYFAYLLCVCISSVSCCIDPLIYCYASSECQRHLSNMLCCKKNSEPCSSSTSDQLMIRTSRRGTCTSTLGHSVYRKLLT
ncbi:proteinase-activated receptor 1 isoform X1 [Sceloporus undulatus]|uniref:proteinase-activated receptor 1 isoform X1 n=1 Tax=Sceloporus undulatus TaxID=8520 RepID=UPI001C4D8A1F|nr:proteinase-activated receptor 1 isoform X1 [Sceloporus undulatus]